MVFSFRKSLNLGGLKLNFSKSGIGVSFGIKGLRTGINAKGKKYISASSNGLNYKKFFILCFVVLLTSNLYCFSAQNSLDPEIQIKFNKQKIKIEKSLDKGNYSKALKLITKAQRKYQDINKSDKEFLSKNADLCRSRINEIKFWRRYYIERDNIAKVIRYFPLFNRGFVKPYIKECDKDVSIYTDINFMYQTQNWLYIKNATIYYDDKTFDFMLDDAGTDVTCNSTIANCHYYEYKRFNWTKYINILREVAKSNTVAIRAYGQYNYLDFYLTSKNIQKLREMIELYDFLKTGKYPAELKITYPVR